MSMRQSLVLQIPREEWNRLRDGGELGYLNSDCLWSQKWRLLYAREAEAPVKLTKFCMPPCRPAGTWFDDPGSHPGVREQLARY